MSNRNAALLLVLVAVRSAGAAPIEISPLPETIAAPLASYGAAAAASIAGPMTMAPALSAAAPVLAAPAAPLLAAPFAAAAAPAIAPAAALSAEAPASAPAADAPLPAPAAAVAAAPVSRGAATGAAALSALAPERTSDGGALFDGSRLSAAAVDAAAVPESARVPAPPVAPSAQELESLFAAAKPKSPAIAVFGRMGGFSAAASQIVTQYTFVNEGLLEGARSAPKARGPRGKDFVQAVKDLTEVADARQDPASRRFLEALGRFAAAQYYAQEAMHAQMRALGIRMDREHGRHMPRNGLGSGDYWDMAAGMNAAGFIRGELEPGTHYSFFDLSPFVVSYLDSVAKAEGADASVVEGDILKLQRPAKPLAVLRTKNAVAYVPNFEKKLEEMADWVAPGGRLVVQNDPMAGQRELILKKHGALAQRLLERGWEMTFEFESARGAEHALDTLIFTRPKGAAPTRTASEAKRVWQRYVDAVKAANRAESGFGFFRF